VREPSSGARFASSFGIDGGELLVSPDLVAWRSHSQQEVKMISVSAKTWSAAALGAMVLLTAGFSLPRGSSTEPDEYNVDQSYAFWEGAQTAPERGQQQNRESEDSLWFRWGGVTIVDAPRLPKFITAEAYIEAPGWNGWERMVAMDDWQVAAWSYDTCEGHENSEGVIRSEHTATWFDPFVDLDEVPRDAPFSCSEQTR